MKSHLSRFMQCLPLGAILSLTACASLEASSGQPTALKGIKKLTIVELVDTHAVGVSLVKTNAHAESLIEAIGLMHSDIAATTAAMEHLQPLATALGPDLPVSPFGAALKAKLQARGLAVDDVAIHGVDLSAGSGAVREYEITSVNAAHDEYTLILMPQAKLDSDGGSLHVEVNMTLYRNNAYDVLYQRSFEYVSEPAPGSTFDARLQQWMAADHQRFTEETNKAITDLAQQSANLFPSGK